MAKYSDEDVKTIVVFLRNMPILETMTQEGISWFIRNDVGRIGHTKNTYTAWVDFEPGNNTSLDENIDRVDCEGFYEAVAWLAKKYTDRKTKEAKGS